MKKSVPALLVAGVLTLVGCSGGDPQASTDATGSAKPCFPNSEVAQLAFEWRLTVAGDRDNPDMSEKAQYAEEYAQRVKDMSWGISEGSDCIGHRESLVLTKEALILAKALDEGGASDKEYENTAEAGEGFMEAMRLGEQGYSEDQIAFPTDPEEARNLIPGQGS
ncbi:hypothetical protein BANT918_02955 [Brevibacterium antiquum CNRZ 918]|uniref:Lipoprotein n=2 Tax=Brevibacteriaceae TaxID=85019 RepID=A0A2H1KWI6_9MICO|nr:hypothetical protein BANT918_02955 [Brevibacterium antiquum CNRZ 918]